MSTINPLIGAGLIYSSVMTKLHLKAVKGVAYNVAIAVLFSVGWSIILQNTETEAMDALTDLALKTAIVMIVAGAKISRVAFDKGGNPPAMAPMLFLGGWVLMNVAYSGFTNAPNSSKILLAVGSMITVMGVMQNRQGELKKVNPLIGAVLFGLGWLVIANALSASKGSDTFALLGLA